MAWQRTTGTRVRMAARSIAVARTSPCTRRCRGRMRPSRKAMEMATARPRAVGPRSPYSARSRAPRNGSRVVEMAADKPSIAVAGLTRPSTPLPSGLRNASHRTVAAPRNTGVLRVPVRLSSVRHSALPASRAVGAAVAAARRSAGRVVPRAFNRVAAVVAPLEFSPAAAVEAVER